MTRIARFRENPKVLKSVNGTEFAGKMMERWAYERRIEIDCSRLGKPTDNATVESFNGRLRQECLNEHWFLSLQGAERKIEAWWTFYNQVRPHSALEWLTPSNYAENMLFPVKGISHKSRIFPIKNGTETGSGSGARFFH